MGRFSWAPMLLLAACGTAPGEVGGGHPGGEPLYEATTTVLESRKHGPMLCLGFIAGSLPPQCGDVPITNWEWEAVEGEERMSRTTWGQYHVLGRYDGKAFTVREVGPPRRHAVDEDQDPFEPPCPEPEGGWPSPDPERSSQEDLEEAQRVARSTPQYAGLWIDYLEPPVDSEDAPDPKIVVTAAFTGDLERHETRLREVWGGPLCMVQHPRSLRELSRIQDDVQEAGEDLGLRVLSSDIDVVDNVVEIHVVVLDEEAREALDERYGEGTVRATAALKPVRR